MDKRRSLIVTAVLLAVFACSLGVQAEVSAERDTQGNFVRTVILANASVKNLKIWTVRRSRDISVALNPDGDQTGDLWPTVMDSTMGDTRSWVVWSRFTGEDFDLAWSQWRNGGWTSIRWLEDAPLAAGDDLDVTAALAEEGRPYITWWRDEAGVGRVYLSLFLATRWMVAYPVSDVGVDSRYPTVALTENGDVQVSYFTPDGLVTRQVAFKCPVTITDDLNPFETMTLSDHDGSGNNLEE